MNRTVLIVEDTEFCRDTLEVLLMKLPGLAVRSVATAEEALECLHSHEVCALITDLDLPRMDGFELIETIRAQPRRSPLPILVISGRLLFKAVLARGSTPKIGAVDRWLLIAGT